MLREQLSRTPFEAPAWCCRTASPTSWPLAAEPEWLERVEPGDFTLEGYTHHAPLTAPMAV